MKLIFALGNPEKQYDGTRHNVGFNAINAFAESHKVKFVAKSKFRAELAEISVAGEKVILARPTTYYNLVGDSYRLLIDYYGIEPSDSLIIHDELALPFGTIRVREGGSDAGNNGIKSINKQGGQLAMRLRIGISNEHHQLIEDSEFVLSKFSKTEQDIFNTKIVPTLHGFITDFMAGKLSVTSHTP